MRSRGLGGPKHNVSAAQCVCRGPEPPRRRGETKLLPEYDGRAERVSQGLDLSNRQEKRYGSSSACRALKF